MIAQVLFVWGACACVCGRVRVCVGMCVCVCVGGICVVITLSAIIASKQLYICSEVPNKTQLTYPICIQYCMPHTSLPMYI